MLPHRTIVAISGRKFHGKDTCANVLTEYAGFEHHNLADPVKDVCSEMFGIPRGYYDQSGMKEQRLKRWPYVTPRKTLQDLAQQMRDLYPDIWVQHFLRKLVTLDPNARIVISDLRYPNEIDMVQQLGGVICFVTRPELEASSAKDTHESESYFEHINTVAQYRFDNSQDLNYLRTQVIGFLKASGFIGDTAKAS